MAPGPGFAAGRKTAPATIGQNSPAPGPNRVDGAQDSQAIVVLIGGNEELPMRSLNPSFGVPSALWTQHREATLNWLALGLLLAAWNAADDSGSRPPRPDSLSAYPCVTVRTMTRVASASMKL